MPLPNYTGCSDLVIPEPSRVNRQVNKSGNVRLWLVKRKQGEDGFDRHERGYKKKMQGKKRLSRHESHDETMKSSFQRIDHDLTLMYAHVLPEVIVTTEVLPASFDRTLVRCDGITQVSPKP